MSEPPNVLLLVLDTARAMNISCYGYGRQTTPSLDEFAADSVLYENAISPSPWTLPAHASMFTGRLPFAHGAHSKNLSLSETIPTLPALFRDAGYTTTLISNNGWLSEGFGITRGFDSVYNMWKLYQTDSNIVGAYRSLIKEEDLRNNPTNVFRFARRVLGQGSPVKDSLNLVYGLYQQDDYHHAGGRITRLIEDRIQADDPFFLVANYLEPHLKYGPPDPHRSKFLSVDASEAEIETVPQDPYEIQFGDADLSDREERILHDLYDGELAHVDHYVGRVLETLRRSGVLDETIVCIVGDHGENIGDHGLLGHNASLHETVLRVPVLIRPPGGDGRRVSDFVQLTDMYRTLLEFAGLGTVASDSEQTFSFDILHPSLEERPDIAVAQYAGLQLDRDRIEARYPAIDIEWWDSALQSISADGYKLLRRQVGADELYDLDSDHSETEIGSDPAQGRVAELESKLDEIATSPLDGDNSVRAFDGDIRRRLEDLGYL